MPRKPAAKPAPNPEPQRKPRSDAQRNREHLLEVARQALTREGANVSLDAIARHAGVGPGTLYRHFPTRDALIEAVYRSEVEKLAAAAPRFAETMPPLEALRAWMLLFIDHVAAKLIIAPALNSIGGGATRLYADSRPQLHGAFQRLVQQAIRSGDLRPDVDPDDILRALVGVFHTTADPGWLPSARRLVDILLAGSRPSPSSHRRSPKKSSS